MRPNAILWYRRILILNFIQCLQQQGFETYDFIINNRWCIKKFKKKKTTQKNPPINKKYFLNKTFWEILLPKSRSKDLTK